MDRRQRIRAIFRAVAPRYDRMNDLMSFGIHRLWKNRLARAARPEEGQILVDLAGGTGDVAMRLAGPGRTVIVCDPCAPMMLAGRHRPAPVLWLAGEAEAIPLADNSTDTVTIAFGIRNVTDLDAALGEMLRVLKPGGRALCLEFSRPAWWLAPFYDLFSFTVIRRLGAWVAHAPEAYHYLVESIRLFPDQPTLAARFRAAGFTAVGFENLSFGIACLHSGTKPP